METTEWQIVVSISARNESTRKRYVSVNLCEARRETGSVSAVEARIIRGHSQKGKTRKQRPANERKRTCKSTQVNTPKIRPNEPHCRALPSRSVLVNGGPEIERLWQRCEDARCRRKGLIRAGVEMRECNRPDGKADVIACTA